MRDTVRILLHVLLLLVVNRPAGAQGNDWLEPFPPFRIAGNLYYVGSRGLASYLVTTPARPHPDQQRSRGQRADDSRQRREAGIQYTDIRILLISHAHWDHNAGSALVKQQTGAKYMVMAGDVPVVESGGRKDFQYGSDKETLYTPTKVDRVLRDGDRVELGGSVLVARLTAGHTKGCTTWTMTVKDGEKSYEAVIIGSPNVNPGYKLVKNAAYPRDCRRLRADVRDAGGPAR